MMSDLELKKLDEYRVVFINSYEEFEEPLEVRFTSNDQQSVETIIASLSTHFSGDPYECWINGEKAVLHLDWGLKQ